MQYQGKLYGCVNGVFFDTGKTSNDWDILESQSKRSPLIEKGTHIEHDGGFYVVDNVKISCSDAIKSQGLSVLNRLTITAFFVSKTF